MGHVKVCTFKSKEDLYLDIQRKDEIIEKLKREILKCKNKLNHSEERCATLEARLEYVERKLKVYDAFFKDEKDSSDIIPGSSTVGSERMSTENDLRRLTRLKQLDSINSAADFK